LLVMIHGLLSGIGTLLWSLVFFVLFVFTVALIFRVTFGPDATDMDSFKMDETSLGFYFRTMPRAMFTTLRCSFGDCSTADGIPLFESVGGAGAFGALMLSCVVFVAAVGLFNIISAVFIERIMEYAQAKTARKMHDKLMDKGHWYKYVMQLISLLVKHQLGISIQEMDKEEVKSVSFDRGILEHVIRQDEEVIDILTELGIDPQDFSALPDLVDCDNTGHIKPEELVSGVSRLRGRPARSDIVGVDLMIRSLQNKVDDLWLGMQSSDKARSKWSVKAM